MNAKTQFSDSMKQNYASQLVKTNEIRTSYYYEKLPSVINKLQDLEKNRIELIRTGILDCISKEREVSATQTMNTYHRGYSQTTLTTFCPFFTTYLPSVNISRGFLLCQLWIVNYYIKCLSNNLSNGVSREMIFQKQLLLAF